MTAGTGRAWLRCLFGFLAVTSLSLLISPVLLGAEGWHHPLFLSGGDYWRQRIPVEVGNPSTLSINGRPVPVPVGNASGEADLAGVDATSLRVVDAQGVEVLFDVLDPTGASVRDGPVPAGSSLVIPVECPAFESVRFWVYFDNPSAWPVPDFLRPAGLLNGGVEEGAGDAPTWWVHDRGDSEHHAEWVEEDPHGGLKCLKLQVSAGAASSWISTRQSSIPVEGGRTYLLSGWVRARNASAGSLTGLYLHVATPQNPMVINQGLNAGSGTYGWKKVSLTFDTPADAESASVGTMLWGSGTAWFDDISLELVGSEPPAAPQIRTWGREAIELSQNGDDPLWFDDNPGDELAWDFRIPLRFFNFGSNPQAVRGAVNLRRYLYRRDLNPDSFRVVDGTTELSVTPAGEELLFDATIPPRSRRAYYLYFSRDPRIPSGYGGSADPTNDLTNLVSNPGFESGAGGKPSGWLFQGATPRTTYGRSSPGRFGDYSATFTVPHTDAGVVSWPGWRQDVPVAPSKTYRYGVWVKLEDVRGTVRAYAHLRDSAGNLVGDSPYLAIGQGLTGTTDWTQLSGTFTIPAGATVFQIHLTMNGTGTLSHDGVLLVGNISSPAQGPIEAHVQGPGTKIWSVPAIVKVFRDDPLPREIALPEVSAARGETEPLQLAVRSGSAHNEVEIQVEAPRDASGRQLDGIEVAVVGYVPVAHTSDYYSISGYKPWERVIIGGKPSGDGVLPSDFGQGSDGWVGWWPDPLIPQAHFSLAADQTQPIWLTMRVPEDAAAGDYFGTVKLMEGSTVLAETRFKVHIWDFDLPATRHLGAIYDVRTGWRYQIPDQPGSTTNRKLQERMSQHRIGPDHVQPEPGFEYSNGVASANYTEFDKGASFLLDTLGVPRVYMPSIFYSFGWANPPSPLFGENPYEGVSPYPTADRLVLREGYKRVYQALLRHFWNHLKEKGWQDRFVLYISDEPHYWSQGIVEQMRALCRMVHAVDPAIPVYSSVWDYVPAWKGFLDIWGIGQFGTVAVPQMKALRDAGDRLWFTTDGQMCIDTPYSAIERLLPHIAFKYDVEAYEFWGVDWLSDFDPYRFGWHSPVLNVFSPSEAPLRVIYPNGDGYLVYPGATVGSDRAVPTLRLAQVREGLEDYELLHLLKEKTAAVQALGIEVADAGTAMERMMELTAIPGPSGRFSTLLLPHPEALYAARSAACAAVERLEHLLQNPPGLPPAGSVPSLIFPQFVNGASPQITRQGRAAASVASNRSRIILRNNSDQKDFGKLVFRDSAGAPIAIPIGGISKEVYDFRLEPWGTLDIETDGNGALTAGVAELYSNLGDRSRIEGTLVYELMGEFVSVPGSARSCFERVYAVLNDRERAALALYNPNEGESIRLELALTDRLGADVAHRSVELGPLTQLAAFLNEGTLFGTFFDRSPGGFEGVVEISVDCSGDFAALGLIQKEPSGALVVVPMRPESEGRGLLVFPEIVNGEATELGTAETIVNRSRLMLFNPGMQPDPGWIRFRTAAGEPARIPVGGIPTDSIQYLVPAHGTAETRTDGTGILQTGVMTVLSDRGAESMMAGSVELELLGHFVSVPSAPAAQFQQAYVSVGNNENTGVALFNPDDESLVRLHLILLDWAGIPVATTIMDLPSGVQVARFVDEAGLFADYFVSHPGPFSGTLNVEVVEGKGVSATSFLQKRSTGALITLPVTTNAFAGYESGKGPSSGSRASSRVPARPKRASPSAANWAQLP